MIFIIMQKKNTKLPQYNVGKSRDKTINRPGGNEGRKEQVEW